MKNSLGVKSRRINGAVPFRREPSVRSEPRMDDKRANAGK